MNLRRNRWAWIGLAVVGLGRSLLAEEPPRPDLSLVVEEAPLDAEVGVEANDEPKGAVVVVEQGAPEGANLGLAIVNDLEVIQQRLDAESQGKYWIGLVCAAPSDVLRTQLDLEADLGLIVEEVYDGGAARKAGILQYDLLLSATIQGSDKPDVRRLGSVSDLVSAVQAAEKRVLKLEFLRRGRKQSLDVAPQERPSKPAETTANLRVFFSNDAGVTTTQHPLGLRWAGPMIVNIAPPALPEGMTMVFHPAEGQPEKVTVKQGDKTWEAEVKALDKLPAEIAPLVQQQLAQRRAAPHGPNFVYAQTPPPGIPHLNVYGFSSGLPDDVTVTVVRKGSEPAQVTIRKGEKSWESTEIQLATLPAEVRPYAEQVLVGRAMSMRATTARGVHAVPTAPADAKWTPIPAHPPGPVRALVAPAPKASIRMVPRATLKTPNPVEMERQLRELSEQVEKLRQAVEQSQPKR